MLSAFFELAWSDGMVTPQETEFLCQLADEMDLSLGARIPLLVRGLTAPPAKPVVNLGEILVDEDERYQVAERLVALCFLSSELSFKQTQTLAGLALQLNIRAEDLEEMRRRVC